MASNMVRLPPLNALKVFWVVMSHGSFRSASDELLISPQAVSQQIRLLEDILGVALFERRSRVVEPTEYALTLSPFVDAGFNELSVGVNRITKASYRNCININVSPYFAMHYLIGRLDRFCEKMPDIDLRLTTLVKLPDFNVDEVDIAIQWGFGEWGDREAMLLVRDPKVICCAPSLLEKIRSPDDLMQAPLLHTVMARNLWRKVLNHLGLEEYDQGSEILFQDAATLRRGTLSGLGVGLISRIDAIDDIKAGRLSAPLGTEVLKNLPEEDTPGFYAVLPKSHKRIKIINSFLEWVKSENWETMQ